MQVAKLLGEKWRALDAAGKAGYQTTAAQQAAALKQQQLEGAPPSDAAGQLEVRGLEQATLGVAAMVRHGHNSNDDWGIEFESCG